MRFELPKGIATLCAALGFAVGGFLAPGLATAEDVSAAAAEEAKGVYAMRCATCHGATGHGDGAAAIAMDPKPKSFFNTDWQKSVTDEHIEKIIVGGGPAVGMSPLMPPNPDLSGKADVVTALRKMVRDFGE